MTTFDAILAIALSAAPWLLIGLLAAALIRALVPDRVLQRWVGGRGLASVSRAAVIGAPFPLCSCGAIPTAVTLHRGGAGRGPTTAFMIGTPGIGVDSLALTYALLGPIMALARAAGAVVTAISTGMLVAASERRSSAGSTRPAAACCGGCDAGASAADAARAPLITRLRAGMRYAFRDLFDDLILWMVGGLILAGVLMTLVPPQAFADYGDGLAAMLLFAVVGVPIYLCAAAATPIAVGMLAAGISPGAALVFLLAAPLTSLATIAVLHREMGTTAVALYLTGIIVTTIAFGLLVDFSLTALDIDIVTGVGSARELLPPAVHWSGLAVLAVLTVPPLFRRMAGLLGHRRADVDPG